MSGNGGFEAVWRERLSRALDLVAGKASRKRVFESADPHRGVSGLAERVESLLDPDTAREVLVRCSCRYPDDQLAEIRERFWETGSIDAAMELLREKFTAFE